MKQFVRQLGFTQKRYVLYCDNQSAIHLAKNSTFHVKSKHIDVRYHWIRDVLDDELIELEKIHTDNNGSDMMTKALSKDKFETCRSIAGMTTTSTQSGGGGLLEIGPFLCGKTHIYLIGAINVTTVFRAFI